MRSLLPQIVFRGLLDGTLVGFLIGTYVVYLTGNDVLRREDFSHALPFEEAEARYASTVVAAFVVVFAFIGPFIAAGSFGPWMRHAIYGLVGSSAVVVAVALMAAMITSQQPFNVCKGSGSTCIDIARQYALPAALLVGPPIGILSGMLLRRRRENLDEKHRNAT